MTNITKLVTERLAIAGHYTNQLEGHVDTLAEGQLDQHLIIQHAHHCAPRYTF